MTKIGRAIVFILLAFFILAACLILTSCGGQPKEKNWLVQSWAQVQGVWQSESYTDKDGETHSLTYSETHELTISDDTIISTYRGGSNNGYIWLWAIDGETYIYHTTIGLTIGRTGDTFGAIYDDGNVVWYCRTSESNSGFEISNK